MIEKKKTAFKSFASKSFMVEGSPNRENGCTVDVDAIVIAQKVMLRVLYRYWVYEWSTLNYQYSGTVESLAQWVTELGDFDADSAFAFVSGIDEISRQHEAKTQTEFWLGPKNLPNLVAY